MKYLISKYPEQESFIKKCFDIFSNMEKYHNVYHFNFLDPIEQIIVKEILLSFPNLNYKFNDDEYSSERKQLVINDDNFDIQIYKVPYQSQFASINHKDVLGSLMGIGLDRSFFGDIYLSENTIEFAFINTMEEYLYSNLLKIKKSRVKLHKIEKFSLQPKRVDKDIITTSLRLDCLLANIFNISRGKAKLFIEEGLVHVNYKVIEDSSYMCNNNDAVISLKKYGKVILKEIRGKTKNDKMILKVSYYC